MKRFTNRAAAVPVLTAPELAQMRKDNAKAAYFTEQALALRTSAARNTAASDFRKDIKRNKDDYNKFKREEFWDTWWRKTKAVAESHGVGRIFDTT